MKLLLLFLLTTLYLPLHAENGRGIVSGKITDNNGLPCLIISIGKHQQKIVLLF